MPILCKLGWHKWRVVRVEPLFTRVQTISFALGSVNKVRQIRVLRCQRCRLEKSELLP